ncbi:MAG: transcription elongation GreA/GreB family factor [Verrucomicrobiales bacterium]|jgi:transcription elongation GreA/GreB family factor
MESKLERLVEEGKLDKVSAEAIDKLPKGAFCLHKSWGVGQVDSWDLIGDRILINFEDKKGHPMKLQFAGKALLPLTKEHVLSRRYFELEVLQKMALEEPVQLMRLTLNSHGNNMLLDRVDHVIKGTIVSEGKYKAWWDKTKKELRKDRHFIVPSKRNIPLELRADDVNPAKAMVSDVLDSSDLKAKVKYVDAILAAADEFKEPTEQLLPVIKDLNESARQNIKLFLPQALDLLLSRMDLQAAFEEIDTSEEEFVVLAEVLASERGRLGETLRSLGVARQRQILELFPEAFPENWVEVVLEMLNAAGLRGIGELTKFLVEQDKQEELTAYLRLGLMQRSLDSNLVAWICKERTGKTADLISAELPAVIMAVLEREALSSESMRRSNRLGEAIQNDPQLIPDLVEGADLNMVRGFARRLLTSPAFDELTRKSLLARIVKIHPDIQELITGKDEDQIEEDAIVVSWESLEAKKGEYDNIINVLIPQNKEEIQIARSYGDLRENAEYKAAKDQQGVLNRQRQEMQRDLERARGTDFGGVDGSSVVPGTIVDLGGGESFTILGAWDGEPEKNIISYTAEAAQALIGKKVGESTELPTESGKNRKVTIKAIKRYAD